MDRQVAADSRAILRLITGNGNLKDIVDGKLVEAAEDGEGGEPGDDGGGASESRATRRELQALKQDVKELKAMMHEMMKRTVVASAE